MYDTIFALASGVGRAGIAIFRISGDSARAVCEELTGREPTTPRTANRVKLRDPRSGELVDDGLAMWFPQPHSYTGEDVLELHLHGSRAVCDSVTEILARTIRPADPGEFTRRAFEHGKMDLTAAEAVADLVNAETAAQRRQALRLMRGELGNLYEGWREALVQAIAHHEAEIDFSDEEIPEGLLVGVKQTVADLVKKIDHHLNDSHRGEILRDGIYVTIIGPPNAGKSTLLNNLAQRDVAIVSEFAGTTRDVIETRLDINGYPVTVADTAGLQESTNQIEREGVRRTLRQAESADLRLAVFDGEMWPEMDAATTELVDEDTVVAINKCDLKPIVCPEAPAGKLPVVVSALSGEGMEALLSQLGEAVAERCGTGDTPSLTRTRHRTALNNCVAALRRFEKVRGVELAAEDLRIAATALGQITGRVDVEEVLDLIFADFCIGK